MDKFYKISGLTVQMSTFGYTLERAKPYVSESADKPDIVIHSDWERLHREQPHLSEEDCEYMSTGASFYNQLLRFGGMLLHASAVMMDGKAYLFSAPCGTGKSTHTSLWKKAFGEDRAQILNDDKPALRFEDGKWYAYGTPWSGKTDQNLNARAELAGICMLCRSENNWIEPFGGKNAVFEILEQTARPGSPQARMIILELLNKLLTHVPVWKMGCNMDVEAAQLSHKTMFEGWKNKNKEGAE